MSTVNVQPTTSARSAVSYALYGTGKRRDEHVKQGTTRAALLSCSLDSPEAIVQRAEQVSAAFNRRNEMYTYTQNFSPEEFDINNPAHIKRVHELGVKLAKRMNSADHLVVTHTDSAGGHPHNHIYVINHDNLTGKALSRCRSWSRGLRQVNDELMRDEGCQVLPDPQQPKPDWDVRREAFKEGGFEQLLGDKVMEALLDPRSVDRAAFEQVLAEHDVRLRVTDRDGWTYSMRRLDNRKWGRKKASALCEEFMSAKVEEVFAFHQQNNDKEKEDERTRQAQGATISLGSVGSLGAMPRSRGAEPRHADQELRPGEQVPERDGQEPSGRDRASEHVDLAAARQALAKAAEQRDREQAERDREDAERSRRAADRENRRKAAERRAREEVRLGVLRHDEEPQGDYGNDDFELV